MKKDQPHPPTSDHPHDERVWDGRLDVERLFVQCLQLLVVLLLSVHLYFKCVHLEELRSFLDIVHTVLRLAGLVQLFDDLGQTGVFTLVKAQLTKLRGRGGGEEGREEGG